MHQPEVGCVARPPANLGDPKMKRCELIVYALLIAVFNLSLIFGPVSQSLIYLPEKVLSFQLYRLITHAFVHVTFYHMLLDGAAFLLLYSMLTDKTLLKRTSYVIASGIGSLIAVTAIMPTLTSTGYCGLSGIAHGLMAVTSLQMIFADDTSKASLRAGIISLFLLIAKSLYEAYTGHMFFEFMHDGQIGSPVAVAHIGGVIGAATMFVINNSSVKNVISKINANIVTLKKEKKMSTKLQLLLIALISISGLCGLASAQEGDTNIAQQAYQLRMSGQLEEAIQLIGDSKEPAAQFELARCHFICMQTETNKKNLTVDQIKATMKSHLDQADAAISKAIKASPNARYYYAAGVIDTFRAVYSAHSVLTIAGLPAGGISSINNYKKALEIDPDYHQARQNLMGLYDRMPWYCGGSKSDAQKQLKILLEKDAIFGARAQCEIHPRKTTEQKIEIWRKVANENPVNPTAHYELAKVYADDKKFDKAKEHIQKAIDLDPFADTMLIKYAQLCTKIGYYQKAEQLIQQFLSQTPGPLPLYKADALRKLAELKAAQGRKADEQTLQAQADTLDPNKIISRKWMDAYDMFTAP